MFTSMTTPTRRARISRQLRQRAENTPQPQQWRRGYMAEAKLASWPWRVASGAIDYVPLVVIFDFFAWFTLPSSVS